jgi:hypothetical protein
VEGIASNRRDLIIAQVTERNKERDEHEAGDKQPVTIPLKTHNKHSNLAEVNHRNRLQSIQTLGPSFTSSFNIHSRHGV